MRLNGIFTIVPDTNKHPFFNLWSSMFEKDLFFALIYLLCTYKNIPIQPKHPPLYLTSD